MEKKLSKCIITDGRELLKDLGIDFEDMEVERPERTGETLKIKKDSSRFDKHAIKENHKKPCEFVRDLFKGEK